VPPLSERFIDGSRDAAVHIITATGKAPLLELEVLQALWRRGGVERRLAQRLFELTGGQIA